LGGKTTVMISSDKAGGAAVTIPAVLARLKATSKGDTAICTVSAMEIEYGLVLNSA
jgi:hypothetical protein